MDYLGIIKKAYEITIKHKFLWIFGIFAGGMAGFRSFSVNLPNYSANGTEWEKTLNNINVNGATLANFWDIYGSLIIVGTVIILLLAIVIFVLNIVSQGALVGSVENLKKGQKADFKTGFAIGAHQFWRILGVAVLYLLMILASLVVLVGPVVLLVVTKGYIFAILWGMLFFFVCLAFWILIALVSPYSLRVVVLEKFGVWQSIRESLHFLREHLKEVIVVYLLLLAIGIGFGIALLLGILLVGGLLLAIGFGVYLASLALAIGYGILAGLAFFIALVVISGAYNSFYSTVLTLTYLELTEK